MLDTKQRVKASFVISKKVKKKIVFARSYYKFIIYSKWSLFSQRVTYCESFTVLIIHIKFYVISLTVGFAVFDLNVNQLQILYLMIPQSAKLVATRLYQCPIKSFVMEVCSHLLYSLHLDGYLATRWLILPIISTLVVDIFTLLTSICRDLFQFHYFVARLACRLIHFGTLCCV